MSVSPDATARCRHCGGKLIRARTTERTKGWAHADVQGHKLTEACHIDPVTLDAARGTTYAEPEPA